jgi:hypothetical protein
MRILFSPEGEARFIYNDTLAEVAREIGDLTIRRASHVEPTHDGQWEADLLPVAGPVLGPFTTRQEALDAEVAWLNRTHIPVPKEEE